jgi:hypothetical protein
MNEKCCDDCTCGCNQVVLEFERDALKALLRECRVWLGREGNFEFKNFIARLDKGII